MNKLDDKKINISESIRQKINELKVTEIIEAKSNSFDDLVNIIESYILLNRLHEAAEILKRTSN